MALPSTWLNQSILPYYGIDEEAGLNTLNLMNWLLPYMSPAEQSRIAQYLYQNRAIDTDLGDMFARYNIPTSTPGSETDFMANIGRVAARGMPTGSQGETFFTSGSPEKNWLESISADAGIVRPGMTREAQGQWRSELQNWLTAAPNENLASLGQALYNPQLLKARYGSLGGPAGGMGTYALPSTVKAGLVSNKYYVG